MWVAMTPLGWAASLALGVAPADAPVVALSPPPVACNPRALNP